MMLDLSWVSTIPWVIGVFLLVKMLFSKADGALRIVSGLPVTGILRGLTIKASEMGVVLAAVTVSVLSISVSLLLSTGVDAIGLACLHLLLPALLLYAMLSLAWDLIGRAMRMLGLPQFASVTAICGLVAMLVGYAMLVLPLVMDIQERWLGGDDAILWATVVGDLAVRIGGLPTGIGASALLLAVTLADVAVSPPRYREQADYLPIHCPAAGRVISPCSPRTCFGPRTRSWKASLPPPWPSCYACGVIPDSPHCPHASSRSRACPSSPTALWRYGTCTADRPHTRICA